MGSTTETWTMALAPQHFAKTESRREGVGYKEGCRPPQQFYRRMEELLAQVRRWAWTPLSWARAWSFAASKNDGK